jgi:uncharacterized protein (TIGR02444 family)
MSDLSERSIWDFALAWYSLPGVEADCLVAQDGFGLDVTALIFALYRTKLGKGFDPAIASELASTLSKRFVDPLRQARIGLKSLPDQVDRVAGEALRHKIKALELEAERLTLTALVGLPIVAQVRSFEGALVAIAHASDVPLKPELAALLKRLALVAQNM